MKAKVTEQGSRRLDLPVGTVVEINEPLNQFGCTMNATVKLTGQKVYNASVYPYSNYGDESLREID